MTTPATGTLQIPNDVLQPIINAHVAGAIAIALGDRSRLIEEAVRFALESRVDSNGKPSTYSIDKTTFLEWLVREAIRRAATAALEQIIAEDAEKIKALVVKEMKNQRSTVARALIEGIAKTASDKTRLSVTVQVAGITEYR